MPVSAMPLRVRWNLDGQEFNGTPDALGREWVIDRETGWSASPPVRNDQAQPRTGAHGGWTRRTYRDPRTIRLDGWVYAPTWEGRRDAEHRLAALCAEPGREYELTCTEETGELAAAVTQDDTTLVTVRPGGRWLDFSLQLVAADPRKYSVMEQTAETGLPSDSATGLDFGDDTAGLNFALADAGLDFGPQLVAGRATATNTGTAGTAPTLILTGPLTPPITISRPDNGASIVYRGQLREYERLVIDINRRTIQLGATSSRRHATVSSWEDMHIPRGSMVEYVLNHDSFSNTTARLHITWHSAWW